MTVSTQGTSVWDSKCSNSAGCKCYETLAIEVCNEYAAQYNVIHNIPSLNAYAAVQMAFKKLHLVPLLISHFTLVPSLFNLSVTGRPHLGHIIANYNDDEDEILSKKRSLIGKIWDLLHKDIESVHIITLQIFIVA